MIAVKMQNITSVVSESPQKNNQARSLRVHKRTTRLERSLRVHIISIPPSAKLCTNRDKMNRQVSWCHALYMWQITRPNVEWARLVACIVGDGGV